MCPSLFPNTEFTKHNIEDVLHVNATRNLGNCLDGITEFLRCKDWFLPGSKEMSASEWGGGCETYGYRERLEEIEGPRRNAFGASHEL